MNDTGCADTSCLVASPQQRTPQSKMDINEAGYGNEKPQPGPQHRTPPSPSAPLLWEGVPLPEM